MERDAKDALISAVQALVLAALINLLTAVVTPEWTRRWWWGLTALLLVAFFLPFYRLRRRRVVIRRVSLASDGNETAHLFGVTGGGAVLTRVQHQDGSWSAWADHGFRAGKAWDVAAVVPVNGRIEVYVVDRSGGVWCRRQDSRTEWSGWTRLRSDQRIGQAVALDVMSGWRGHREIYVVTENGDVAHCWQWDKEPWSEWYSAEIADCRDVALSTPLKDQLEAFVVDRHGRTWHRWYVDERWSPWESLGEPDAMSAPIAIAALNGEPRHQEIFVVGAAGEVAHRWHWQDEAWDPWYDKRSPDHVVDIAAAATSRSRFRVVTVSAAGKLWQQTYVPVGNWSVWESF
ncbi:hypothetical protein [Actinoplanes sp. NPDC089786]|uniref:hypothetical protein n=1 Tax=Actinoplanes sp. NPDC089786 TaxID=3155185 RepID=UPI003435D35C